MPYEIELSLSALYILDWLNQQSSELLLEIRIIDIAHSLGLHRHTVRSQLNWLEASFFIQRERLNGCHGHKMSIGVTKSGQEYLEKHHGFTKIP